MYRPLSLFIGLRMLSARRRNQTISFFALSSIIGIALGVSVLILVLSAMNGFQRELEQRLLAVLPQAELEAVDGSLDDWRGLAALSMQHPLVEAAAPYVQLAGLLQKGNVNEPLSLRGVSPEAEAQASRLDDLMVAGDWDSLAEPANNIILSERIANRLGLGVGETTMVLLPQLSQGTALKPPKLIRFTVTGLFDSAGQLEQNLALVPLSAAAELEGLAEGRAAGVRLTLGDVFAAPAVVRDVGYAWNEHLLLKDWTRTQGYLYQDIQLVRFIAYIVLMLVITVASFNVISTLIVTVRDKQADIAILRTMGAGRRLLMSTFVVQGMANGVLGIGIGAALGSLIGRTLPGVAAWLERSTGLQLLSADIYFIDYIPSQVLLTDVMGVVVVALVICLLATLYPAWRATQVAPAVALGRGG